MQGVHRLVAQQSHSRLQTESTGAEQIVNDPVHLETDENIAVLVQFVPVEHYCLELSYPENKQ